MKSETTTTRKYYFKPDAESLKVLPEIFRTASRQVNSTIIQNNKVLDDLEQIRLADPDTCKEQQLLNQIKQDRQDLRDTIIKRYQSSLDQLRGKHHYYMKNPDPVERKKALDDYNKLKADLKKELKDECKKFDDYWEDKRSDAFDVVKKANSKEYTPKWEESFQDLKENSAYKQKYQMDHYKKNGIKQARSKLFLDERIMPRKFVRGYGTNFPEFGSVVTGHCQSGSKSDKARTVSQWRDFKQSKGHIQYINFPKQFAWDLNLPKGERRKNQIGGVGVTLLGHKIQGTCLFHQSIPEDYCIAGVSLSVNVHSGNIKFYLSFNIIHKSEVGRNNYDKLCTFFNNLGDIHLMDLSELKETKKTLELYKTKLTTKHKKKIIHKKLILFL
jgi:hypothetical protein